jgi:hypothetical protein
VPSSSTRAHSWLFRNFRSPGISFMGLFRAKVGAGRIL